MLMRRLLIVVLLLQVFADLLPAEEPQNTPAAPPPNEMEQKVAQLRTTQALALLSPPLKAEEIAARRKLYEDVITSHPKDAEPRVAYGEFLLFLERKEEAFQQWDSALVLDPQRHDILAAQSDLLLQTGQIVAAADAMEKAVALEPKNAFYHYTLAHIYTMFRRDLMAPRRLTENELITRGTEYFRQAALLAPENLSYAQGYAEAFYTQPDPDWTLARTAWESLLEKSPQKSFIRSHLVRVNIRLRDKAAAAAHLAALDDPAFAQVKERLQKQVDRL
jgi:tetratricopeptide (TPR) repeat protein